MKILSEMSDSWASRGWSFIPLNGDLLPGAEKAPALPTWKVYQSRHPSADERKVWFDAFNAAGIVLGKISGVVAIDIDDKATAEAFAIALPDLIHTFTVQSGNRGLPHYYYAIDGSFTVPNIRTKQIELRSDGSYVVAPGVRIGAKTWQITNDISPRQLTKNDLERIELFMNALVPKPIENELPLAPLRKVEVTASQLQNRYNYLAPRIGRNNALFNCGRYARDRGCSADQVEDALMILHVNYPSLEPRSESPESRQREAQRTIDSVYRHLPKSTSASGHDQQLPNSVREALLQRGDGYLARFLDAMFMIGVRVGDWINVGDIMNRLIDAGIAIGRRTVYQALRVAEVFTPQAPHADADTSAENIINQCLIDRRSTGTQSIMGRPATYWRMPSLSDLCAWLGVVNRGGDRVTADDLRSATHYRRALYQSHIKRAPGAYTRQWQSQRLGISPRTCRRYDRECGVKVYPRYHETPIHWANVDTTVVDADQPTSGRFMMDDKGRRFPEIRTLAKKLLGMGRRLSLMVQGANYYQVESANATLETSHTPTHSWTVSTTSTIVIGDPTSASKHLKQPSTSRQRRSVPSIPDIAYPGMEDRLYNALRAINADKSISKQTAKEWTKGFGGRAVYRALKVLEARKDVIKNPAGFMRILLQQYSSWRPAPALSPMQDADATGWEKFLNSKHAHIFKNYEDLKALSTE